MAGSMDQYDNPNNSWMGGRGGNQYDTGQNRNCDPGAAFLGEHFTLLLCCVVFEQILINCQKYQYSPGTTIKKTDF